MNDSNNKEHKIVNLQEYRNQHKYIPETNKHNLEISHSIFNETLPDGATSFTSDGQTATFIIGETGKNVKIGLNADQVEALYINSMLGASVDLKINE